MRLSTYADLAVTIEGVLRFIQANLDEPLDVRCLASVAGYSPYHFQRAFRKLVGESPIEHVRRLRLERAAYQLRTTSHSVTSIAIDAGFESIAGFSRSFEDAFSVPPTAYRSAEWKLFWQTAPSGIHFDPENEFTFDPLVKDDAISEAAIRLIDPIHVLALENTGVVNYRATWLELKSRLIQAGLNPNFGQQYSFTHEPRQPRQAWKVRGFSAVSGFEKEPIPFGAERHWIGGGFYMVKRMVGSPIQLGDFWARAWHQDVTLLNVRPRCGCAFNHLVSGFESATLELEAVVDIYLPIDQPEN